MKHIAFLLALLLPFSISAASYSDIMNVAEEMSIEEKNAAISYESSLLSASLLDKEDEMGYSVSLRAEPFQYDDAISITALDANNLDASLIHEAAIGKIAGEELLKLRTFGLTEEEAEERIIKGFLR